MHGLATEFMSYAPSAPLPIPLAAALVACARTGYCWGSNGGAEAAAGAEAEVPLAAVVLKRLGELADAPSGLRDPEYRSWVSNTGVPYSQWDTHVYLWEAMPWRRRTHSCWTQAPELWPPVRSQVRPIRHSSNAQGPRSTASLGTDCWAACPVPDLRPAPAPA